MTGFVEPDEGFDLQVRILDEDYDVQLSKNRRTSSADCLWICISKAASGSSAAGRP